MKKLTIPQGFEDMQAFGLLEALLGRRSRRFFRGAEIPDGVFAYKSRHQIEPLSELEKLLVVTACGGNTSWHHLIYRAQQYAPLKGMFLRFGYLLRLWTELKVLLFRLEVNQLRSLKPSFSRRILKNIHLKGNTPPISPIMQGRLAVAHFLRGRDSIPA